MFVESHPFYRPSFPSASSSLSPLTHTHTHKEGEKETKKDLSSLTSLLRPIISLSCSSHTSCTPCSPLYRSLTLPHSFTASFFLFFVYEERVFGKFASVVNVARKADGAPVACTVTARRPFYMKGKKSMPT